MNRARTKTAVKKQVKKSQIDKSASLKRYTIKRNKIYYISEIILLGIVISAALFIPQMIFQVQDYLLCRDTVLDQKESLDVGTLGTAYEKSLGARMLNYADAIAENESFYVTSQTLDVNEELTRYLYSDAGLYSDIFMELRGFFPENLWYTECVVNVWKQYVIYSDNYTRGVNFILWYIELRMSAGGLVKMLVDAEDGTIYAIKTEDNIYEEIHDDEAFQMDFFMHDYVATGLWGWCAMYYEARSQQEINDLFSLMSEYGGIGMNDSNLLGERYEEIIKDASDKEAAKLLLEMSGQIWYWLDGDRGMIFKLPFGDHSLEVRLNIQESKLVVNPAYLCPDVIMGVREIYEKIPEFL